MTSGLGPGFGADSTLFARVDDEVVEGVDRYGCRSLGTHITTYFFLSVCSLSLRVLAICVFLFVCVCALLMGCSESRDGTTSICTYQP